MGQQSKAIQARLKNLHKHVTTQKKAYVEDVTDEEVTDYNPTFGIILSISISVFLSDTPSQVPIRKLRGQIGSIMVIAS
jgi:hypothetical protein